MTPQKVLGGCAEHRYLGNGAVHTGRMLRKTEELLPSFQEMVPLLLRENLLGIQQRARAISMTASNWRPMPRLMEFRSLSAGACRWAWFRSEADLFSLVKSHFDERNV